MNAAEIHVTNTTVTNHTGGIGGGFGMIGSLLVSHGGRNIIQDNTAKMSFFKGDQIGYIGSTVDFTACPPGKFYNSPLRSAHEEPIVGCPDDCPLGTFAPGYGYRENSCPVCQTGRYCSDTKSHPTKCDAGRFVIRIGRQKVRVA